MQSDALVSNFVFDVLVLVASHKLPKISDVNKRGLIQKAIHKAFYLKVEEWGFNLWDRFLSTHIYPKNELEDLFKNVKVKQS